MTRRASKRRRVVAPSPSASTESDGSLFVPDYHEDASLSSSSQETVLVGNCDAVLKWVRDRRRERKVAIGRYTTLVLKTIEEYVARPSGDANVIDNRFPEIDASGRIPLHIGPAPPLPCNASEAFFQLIAEHIHEDSGGSLDIDFRNGELYVYV